MKRISVKGTIISNDVKWIYDWFGIDSVCPKDVESQVEEAAGEPIIVEINSGGGEVLAGSEIYYLFATYEGDVSVDIVGFAGSAASYIMAAGDKVRIIPTGMVMIHNVSGSARGDYHAMDKESKVLRSFNKAISNAYRLKTGLSESELLNLMDKETWMPAQDAKDKGFVDEIIGDENNILEASSPKGLYNGFGSANIIPNDVIEKIRNTIKDPAIINDGDPPTDDEPKPQENEPESETGDGGSEQQQDAQAENLKKSLFII